MYMWYYLQNCSSCKPDNSPMGEKCQNEGKVEKQALEFTTSDCEERTEHLHFESLLLRDDTELLYINPDIVELSLKSETKTSDAAVALEANSDLIPNVYEGGLKVWECSYDLVNFLCDTKTNFKDSIVLELGCGAGLPGIYALRKGARVHFQDYNEEVIKHMTIPNVQANSEKSTTDECNCRFFSGDWGSFQGLLQSEQSRVKYDMILTSETIYNTDSYTKLHNLFKNTLKKDGIIYIAAKTYYFGVGGGTRSFETLLDEKGVFQYSTVKSIEKGVRREILELKFKNNEEVT